MFQVLLMNLKVIELNESDIDLNFEDGRREITNIDKYPLHHADLSLVTCIVILVLGSLINELELESFQSFSIFTI